MLNHDLRYAGLFLLKIHCYWCVLQNFQFCSLFCLWH